MHGRFSNIGGARPGCPLKSMAKENNAAYASYLLLWGCSSPFVVVIIILFIYLFIYCSWKWTL